MPGIQTPSTADSAQVLTAMTATSRSWPSTRSAAWRRSSARSSFLGAPAFGIDLRAFHLHARAVAIERLLQGRDDDAGEPGFDLAQAARGVRQPERAALPRPATPATRPA